MCDRRWVSFFLGIRDWTRSRNLVLLVGFGVTTQVNELQILTHLSVRFWGSSMSNPAGSHPLFALVLHLFVASIGLVFGPLRRASPTAAPAAHALADLSRTLPGTVDCICHCNLTSTCESPASNSEHILIPVIGTFVLSFVVLVKVGCCITRGTPVDAGKGKYGKGSWGVPLQ